MNDGAEIVRSVERPVYWSRNPPVQSQMIRLSLILAVAASSLLAVDSDDRYRALYESGLSYADFLEGADRRQDTWIENTENGEVPEALLERAEEVGGTWHLLAVAVDGCSDSVGTIPYLADLVDAVPGLTMRIIGSGAGKSIMESHHTPDGRPATPTVLLLDEDFEEAGAFIERPTPLQEWALQARKDLSIGDFLREKAAWYGEDLGHKTMEELVMLMEAAADSREE